MKDYLIIDSNENFAELLYQELTGEELQKELNFLNSQTLYKLKVENPFLKQKIKPEFIILINAEGKTKNGYLQEQILVELVFWIRCKYKLKNTIVIYSLQSVTDLLKQTPENFIIQSPGCYHFQLPLTSNQLTQIKNLTTLKTFGEIKPYVKSKIDLGFTRHRFANYAAMILLFDIAKSVWDMKTETINEIFQMESSKEMDKFRDSLQFALLTTYFGLDSDFKNLDHDQKDILKCKFTDSNKTLLVDDFAERGWKAILSKIIYGNHNTNEFSYLKLPYSRDNTKNFDFREITESLAHKIDSEKPHLILLDLRLRDEEGKIDVENLGGYKLLKYLKNNSKYKGLPIVMFTASSNAETTKKLIDAGAEYVWTKPGIDERLSKENILERYKTFIEILNKICLRYKSTIETKNIKFDTIRLNVIKKNEFHKYRGNLTNLKNSPHFFNDFTDIFVDANIVLEEPEAICRIYKLAQICGTTEHEIILNGKSPYKVSGPKLVFVNFVIDEIAKFAKTITPDKPELWKVALLGFETIRTLFAEGKIRTEYDPLNNDDNPNEWSQLTHLKKKRYADPVIVSEIKNIVSRQPFTIQATAEARSIRLKSGQGRQINVQYNTENINILLLTSENKREFNKIPRQLTNKIHRFVDENTKYSIYNYKEFTDQLDTISL